MTDQITEAQIIRLRQLCAARAAIQEEIDQAAAPLVKVAHKIIEADKGYNGRSGYYPEFTAFDDDGELIFDADNSYDGNIRHYLTAEALLAGPEPVIAKRFALDQAAVRRELAAAESRAERLRLQLAEEN